MALDCAMKGDEKTKWWCVIVWWTCMHISYHKLVILPNLVVVDLDSWATLRHWCCDGWGTIDAKSSQLMLDYANVYGGKKSLLTFSLKRLKHMLWWMHGHYEMWCDIGMCIKHMWQEKCLLYLNYLLRNKTFGLITCEYLVLT